MSMLIKGDCEGCEDKPTIFLTQIVNGEVRAHNLCRDCPHMDEVNDPAGCALAEMLLKLSDKPAVSQPPGAGKDDDFSDAGENAPGCPGEKRISVRVCGCGMSIREFEQSQRLGCPHCYETFHEKLMNTLKTSQTRGHSHRGKMPGPMREIALRRESLDRELDEAIHAENFERAARIRDLMRQLDHGSARPGR